MLIEELLAGPTGGRHALDEDAVHTPIFAALTRGGWRGRQQERTTSSWEEFRRDPLTAPIPVQLVASSPSRRDVSSRPPVGRAPAAVTGAAIAGLAGCSAHSSGAATERNWGSRSGRRRAAAEPREWPGLAALAEPGRHHLRPVANW